MVKSNLPGEGIQLIEDTSRESSVELMKAVGYVDLLIPRGGPGLIRSCVENAKVPCIQTGTGICHVYVDESADFEKALQIIENAKPAVQAFVMQKKFFLFTAQLLKSSCHYYRKN